MTAPFYNPSPAKKWDWVLISIVVLCFLAAIYFGGQIIRGLV
jgi:hypothetical protein